MTAHGDRSAGDAGDVRRLTRRTVLAGCAATAGGFAVLPEPAAARQEVQEAVIPSPDRWSDENLAGFMIHLGDSADPGDVSAAEGCSFGDWPPDDMHAYEAYLINRKQGDTPEVETTLFTAADVDVPPGALYLINTFERCESEYVGVRLESIGQDVAANVEADERPNRETAATPTETAADGTAATGPGFGPVAAVGGVAGLGALLARRLRRD